MAGTMKAKIDAANEQAAATVEIRVGKKSETVVDAELADAIRRGLGKMELAEEATLHYKGVKARIAEVAKKFLGDRGSLTLRTEGAICRITFAYECVIAEDRVEECKKLLGARFEDLVREKTAWTGTGKLVELACDADSDLGKAIRPLLTIKEKSPAFDFLSRPKA